MQTKLLILLFFCHFLADYTHLSTNWMLSAKRFGKPIVPILVHAIVHSCVMYIAIVTCLYFYIGKTLIYFEIADSHSVEKVCLFQLITHFLIDLWKGKMNYWFPSVGVPSNKVHWYIFGIDQYLHAIVIILMVNYIV